ncbi:LacI family DNA-binding transcriptional regulator [Microbacterium sp.]|uniref:LacI family DNA-binding transcriptional regulator n=1 Tax=Microbacterium sp. TaxID=51671 RepID=UPI00333F4984
MTPPSVREIARRIDLSPATVSRVLNGRPGVAADTRERVLRAVREMGVINRSATGGALVGIIVPELENPAFAVLAGAVESKLAAHGIIAVIGSSTKHGPTELDYLGALLAQGVRGLVLVSGRHANPSADHGFYRDLHRERVPMVLVGGRVPDLPVPTVSCDEATGTAMAVAHLHDLGHSRIGLAGGQRYLLPSQNRLRGYLAAMHRYVGGVDERLYAETDFTISGGHSAARRLLAAGATAIVAGSDLMALGAIAAARDEGRDVPGDMSVVGYDDSFLAAHSGPSLTTLRQPIDEMADAAARALVEQLNGYETPAVDHLFRPSLVVRRSTGALGPER